MKGYVDDIETRTEENADFRRVLYTGKNMQLVLMALRPGEEIGEEVHPDRDQFFRVEVGEGEVWIDGQRKLCSIGVTATHWITWHGLALNHEPDLTQFAAINPCGFDAAVMTSMRRGLWWIWWKSRHRTSDSCRHRCHQ